MLPSIIWKEGEAKDVTLGANSVDFKIENSYPQGLIREISLRMFTTAFALGGGSAVTDGEKRILRSLSVYSTLHGTLYQNIDGRGLYRLMTMIFGRTPAVTAVASGGFSTRFPIPFGFLGTLRHPAKRLNDMSLWAYATKPLIEGTIGPITDVVSGGSPTGTVRIRPVFEYEPNPSPLAENPAAKSIEEAIRSSGDRPKYQIEVIRTRFASLSTTGIVEQNLPIGQGRIPLYLMLQEKNSSTDAEVSDIFTADTSMLELRHGSDVILNRTKVTDWDGIMADFLNVTLPTGCHLIPLAKDGKILDSVPLDNVSEFKLSADNLATASTRNLDVYIVNAKPVKEGAEPENQKA